jgi:hypothetical protein
MNHTKARYLKSGETTNNTRDYNPWTKENTFPVLKRYVQEIFL